MPIVPYADRGYSSKDEWYEAVDRIDALPVNEATKDEFKFRQPKVAVDAMFASMGAKPLPKVEQPYLLPTARAPQPIAEIQAQLARGAKASAEARDSLYTVKPTQTPEEVQADDRAYAVQAARILARPRDPQGEVLPGFWERLADTPEDQWGPDALRPQVLLDPNQTAATKAEPKNFVERWTTEETSGPQPSTIESPVGVLFRWLAAPTSGVVGVAEDIAHAVGLGSDPESGGVAERIREGGGFALGGRDVGDYLVPVNQDSIIGGKALPPQPEEGRPTQEWLDWSATWNMPADLRAAEPKDKPSKEWLDWKKQLDVKNNTRSQVLGAAMLLGLVGDLVVPIDLGASDYVSAAKALRATRLAEAGIEGAETLTTGGKVYAALVDAMGPLAAKGKQLREEGVLRAVTSPYVEAVGDPRLVAVERIARGSETQKAAKAWTDAVADAVADGSPTLATADAKVAETWGRLGLPTQTEKATQALDELRDVTGIAPKGIPDPIDVARASVGARMAEAARLPARFTQRIGDVAVPSSAIPEIRAAIAETPAGQAAASVRDTLTHGKSPAVIIPQQTMAEVAAYLERHGLSAQTPSSFQDFRGLEAVDFGGKVSRVPAAEWNRVLKLTAEAEASRLVPGMVERARTVLPADNVAGAERLSSVFSPAEVRPGKVEVGVGKALNYARELLAPTVAPVKHVSPQVTEWMDRTMARMASVDEMIHTRVRRYKGATKSSQPDAYAYEFGDAWSIGEGGISTAEQVVDHQALVTDIVSGAYGSVLGLGAGVSNGMDAKSLYKLVAALTRVEGTNLARVEARFAGLTGVELYEQSARLAGLPGASGRSLGDFISAEDIAKLKADSRVMYQWDLTPSQVDAAYARMASVTPRIMPQDAQDLLSALHVGRRAEQVAQESLVEFQAMMPNSIPSQPMLRTVMRNLDGAFAEVAGSSDKVMIRGLPRALITDFNNAVRKELQQAVNLPNPTSVPGAYDQVAVATRALLANNPRAIDFITLDTEITKQAKAYVATLQQDLGGVISKPGARYVTEELAYAIRDAIHPVAPMPLRAADSLRHQTFMLLEDPAIQARMESLAGFSGITEGMSELAKPVVPRSLFAELSNADIASGLDRMKDLQWAATPWDTAVLRWANNLWVNLAPTAKGMTRSGMLGGFVLPNFGYHIMNALTAPAIIWQTVGGKMAGKSLFSSLDSLRALQYYYGYVGGMNNVDGLKILFRSQDGVAYTVGNIAEIIAKESISRSQASFELSNSIMQDVTRWSGLIMKDAGPEEIIKFRKFLRNLDPRRSNVWNEAATAMDNLNRTNVLIASLRAGKTEEEAVKLARASLFDYGNLTAFERKYIAKNFLFYSFLRHNVTTTTSALLSNPSRALHLLRLSQGLPEEITGQDGETTFARHFNSNPFTGSRPFLAQLNSTDAKRRFGMYGPPIPFADALSTMYGWAAMFTPLADDTLKPGAGLGLAASNVAIETVSHLDPYLQAIGTMATGQTFSFGERRETGTYLNPKLVFWMTLNPTAWETMNSLMNIEIIPVDELDPYKSMSVGGLSYRLPKGDRGSAAFFQGAQAMMMTIGAQRLAQDAAAWGRGEDWNLFDPTQDSTTYDNPPSNAEPGSEQYKLDVANYRAMHRTPSALEVPHDLAISKYSSPLVYEFLRNLGAISIQPDIKSAEDLQGRQDNQAMYDARDYPRQ